MLTLQEKKEIGKRIKDARIERGLKQKDVANKVGAKTVQMLSGWETGNVVPQLDNLIKISQFYNLSLDYIIAGKKKTETDPTIYSYKDIIQNIYFLMESGLFRESHGNAGLSDLNQVSIYTYDKVLNKFAEKFETLVKAQKAMKPDLFKQAIKDLINEYDYPIKQK